jgi:gliding motility-associated-like protein
MNSYIYANIKILTLVKKIIFFFLLITSAVGKAQLDFDILDGDSVGCESLKCTLTPLNLTSAVGNEFEWEILRTFPEDPRIDIIKTEKEPEIELSEPGIYEVSLMVNNSQIKEKERFLVVHGRPDSTIWFENTPGDDVYDYTFFNKIQVLERAGLNYNRSWNINNEATFSTRQVNYVFPDTGIYRVALRVGVRNYPECYSDTVFAVRVRPNMKFPNYFTPNDDLRNDLFVLRYDGVTNISINIYSRYGNLVYKESAPVIIWDGRSIGGQKLREGVYYYAVKTEDGVINEARFVHLFRSQSDK